MERRTLPTGGLAIGAGAAGLMPRVACLYNSLGTATNSAVELYLNQQKVPQLFVGSGADKWGNYRHFPWTIGFQPSYRMEARIYKGVCIIPCSDAPPGG